MTPPHFPMILEFIANPVTPMIDVKDISGIMVTLKQPGDVVIVRDGFGQWLLKQYPHCLRILLQKRAQFPQYENRAITGPVENKNG